MMFNVCLSDAKRLKFLITGGTMLALLFVMSLTLADTASAHGNVTNSRAGLCADGVNKNCGLIIYEPYSLEALKGFPAGGPADGKIASANGAFAPLDQQSATRWSKVNISSGPTTFNWKIKVPHATASWKYYITKQNWNPDAPLTRDSFDLTPFCNVPYNGKMPGNTYSDTCNVPSRTGYQVILAVWEISDTLNAFYNVIDVNFGGDVDNVAPTAPTGAAVSNIGSTSATISWSASTDNVGVTGYRIFSGSNQIGATTGPLTSNLTGLTSNTLYTITVKAVDAAGNLSAASNTVSFTTLPVTGPDTAAPTAPNSLHVMGSSTSTTVPLMWNASTDNVGVTGYQIFKGTTLIATVSGSTVEYLVTGLTANTLYTFSVKAIDAAGNVSPASNVLNVTTPPAPTTYPAWSAAAVYVAGNKVTHNGVNYEAKWWTQGETPGTSGADVWKVIS
ncbi:lytic polysaccharide monooxygenase [Paenibacillus sp. UMB4589-SE434]|uniref:lytic polysaccharide monooxygenase n=1 Tax=Paenibacillus sp. UMB4589-SE434 TaxID=3046314 RepID=UPI0025504644|nr:lytic polysaccharide monooxygenase [Paenibacillus sp. UMB4589-SE434]MDK8180339.1 lytic polysaccharide monooxygenase [Paenibacillus sp. UMB4589-SE434]